MARATSIDKKSLGLAGSKLEESGLDMDDAKVLGIKVLGAQATNKLSTTFKALSSLQINYYDPVGKPLTDWPGGGPFYRIRYLEFGTDFTSLTEEKPQRYTQPPNTAPVAYYPKNFDGWAELCLDTNQPLIITEGELKSAKACKEGFPTLGLGGVYNWRSNRLGIDWLPSLDPIKWVRRHVYICFDSDYKTNPMVCSALRNFAEELQRRGAFVHIVSLPQLPKQDKVGLDDFLVHAGSSSVSQFEDLLSESEPLGLSAPLWEMNDSFVYVRNPGIIVDRRDMENKISPAAFKDHLCSTQNYQERQLKPDGSISYKTVSAAATWLRWPLRVEVSKLTYKPGKESFVEHGESLLFNTWPGWGVQPKKGDVTPFKDLIDHLFKGSEPKAKEWFMRWLAYPLQYPGVKMYSSAVVHGIKHGTGKSLIGYTLGRIYGDNFAELNSSDLTNRFNEWAESKQFALGDDITGSNKRADADYLKKMITQERLRLNPKHIRSYVVPDCINYYFTSNQPDAFFLEDDDRRFFIHEVIGGPLPEEFYVEYDLWLDSGGSAAVFDYLLNLDLDSFNPAAPAYRTSAKDRMINTGRSDLASWVRQLIAVPDHTLVIGSVTETRDLLTSKELLAFYDPEGRTGTTANGLARELNRAGVRQVVDGQPIRLSSGNQARYYAVRNPEKWLSASPKAIAEYLDSELSPKKTKKY